jgi:hypothetical protein
LFLFLSLKKDRLTFWVEWEGNFGGCEKGEKGEKGEKREKGEKCEKIKYCRTI